MQTIVLTGMMGSGKSTVAELFAKSNKATLIDIDTMLELQEGKSISEIFAQNGEQYFRRIEHEIIMSIFEPEDLIISLGGGAFENKDTRKFLLENSKVVYLKTSPTTIYERIKNNDTRPLLQDDMSIEKIEEILNKRENNYSSAHLTINTDNKTPQQIAWEINND